MADVVSLFIHTFYVMMVVMVNIIMMTGQVKFLIILFYNTFNSVMTIKEKTVKETQGKKQKMQMECIVKGCQV